MSQLKEVTLHPKEVTSRPKVRDWVSASHGTTHLVTLPVKPSPGHVTLSL